MTDSARLTRRIQANIKGNGGVAEDVAAGGFECPVSALHPVITSHVFWPRQTAATVEEFELSPALQQAVSPPAPLPPPFRRRCRTPAAILDHGGRC
jgi:hypothetical protein